MSGSCSCAPFLKDCLPFFVGHMGWTADVQKNLLTSCLGPPPPSEENKAKRGATVTDGRFLGGTWKYDLSENSTLTRRRQTVNGWPLSARTSSRNISRLQWSDSYMRYHCPFRDGLQHLELSLDIHVEFCCDAVCNPACPKHFVCCFCSTWAQDNNRLSQGSWNFEEVFCLFISTIVAPMRKFPGRPTFP